MNRVNRQGQAHIASTASRLRSIDPQPASISPTINISIVFICAFLVDAWPDHSPSGNQKRKPRAF
jgi:hypothetical protein